ncbi:MAG: hypothetical protein [Bacteriophage sp.]|nr:MAG: hypothetical protein [Bacteriophage sp.]
MLHTFAIKTERIICESERAFLIDVPHEKFAVWIPNRLVRVTNNPRVFTILIPDDFNFWTLNLKRQIKGKVGATQLRHDFEPRKQ